MNRRTFRAGLALAATTVFSCPALAQEGHGTVSFTISVSGVHSVPTPEGGFRRVQKNRTFTGKARLKYAGNSFAQQAMKGYDKAGFEREKDACERKSSDETDIAACQDEVQARQNAAERAAMRTANPIVAALQAPRAEVWSNDGCTGNVVVADKGTYRGITVAEGGTAMREVEYSLAAAQNVDADASAAAGRCSFNLVYDPHTQTAQIAIDPGPSRIAAVERVGLSSARTNINPLDWSAVRKFEKGNLKVVVVGGGHSGAWSEARGEPMALSGAARASGEVVETVTRVTWQFSGHTPASRTQGGASDEGLSSADNNQLAGCLREQKKAERAQPDPVKLLECLETKKR